MLISIITLLLSLFLPSPTQDLTAEQIIKKSEENFRGATNIAEIKMTINRPKWTREMVMKSWSIEDRLVMILVKEPARDKGTAFLKNEREIWNWVPSIEKVVKLPPSMMMQSWMGSDFTNDDLVQSASLRTDYTHELMGTDDINGTECYKIVLTPKPEAPVVWGKLITWISTDRLLQMQSEFYDEDDDLINVLKASEIKEMDGRYIPTKLMVTPVNDEGNSTIIEYLDIDFEAEIDESMFTVQQMKRLRG